MFPAEAELETLDLELNSLEAHRDPLDRHSAWLNRHGSALNREFPRLEAEFHSLKLEKKSVAVESFLLNAQYICSIANFSHPAAESKILAFECLSSDLEQKRLNAQQKRLGLF